MSMGGRDRQGSSGYGGDRQGVKVAVMGSVTRGGGQCPGGIRAVEVRWQWWP
jgi:hypothetical protein